MDVKTYKIDLNVIVEKALGGTDSVQDTLTNGTSESPAQTQRKTQAKETAGNTAMLFVKQYAKMGVNAVISNWGDMTGDYIAQENLQLLSNIVDTGITFAINWKVGLAKVAVETVSGIASYIKSKKESERISRFNLYRVGYGVRE